MKKKQPDPSSAALRAFAVLETVVRADRPIAMTEIVEAHGLPKPTVFRLLATLEEAGLVTREPADKCYSAGPRLAQLGLAILTNQSVRRERRAILQRISEETGETCNLTMVDGIDVVYVDRVDSQWPLRIDLKPGSRVPLHCSASGKLFLSQLPRGKRSALIESLNLTRCTEHTITQRDALEAELERIRKTGVGIDNEEFLAGLLCVAVPVCEPAGRHVATIALQAPSARLSLERAMDCVPMLRRAAEAMSRTFPADPQKAGAEAAKPARGGGRAAERQPRRPA